MTPLQAAAIEYIEAGLRILALHQKRPNGRVHGESWSWDDSFWSDGPLSDSDRAAVEDAFAEAKGTTGIAILIPPDYLVADVDTDRAAALLLELGYQPDKESITAKTKNGLHIWFWWPGADRNRWLGDGQQPDPSRTLLFKGLGGYVVAPPSLHFDAAGVVDGSYSWGTPLVLGGRRYMPDILPAEAGERMKRADLWSDDREQSKPELTNLLITPVEGVPWWQWQITRTYALEGLERAIIGAADGNQNNLIHWAAMTALEEGVPYDVAMDRLLAAAIKGGHPRNRARDTIKGAYKRVPRG